MLYVGAAGFDPKSDNVESLDKDYTSSGVPILSNDEERRASDYIYYNTS